MAKINGTVCIIDPDRDLHGLMAAALALEGYRVVSSSRARDALNKIDLQRFAALFIDPGQPQDKFDEIFRQISAAGAMNAKTPLILMGTADAEIPPAAASAPAAILVKPFTVDECVGALRAVVGRKD